MTLAEIHGIIQGAIGRIGDLHPPLKVQPQGYRPEMTLEEAGIDATTIGTFAEALRRSLGGIASQVEWMWRMHQAAGAVLPPDQVGYKTLNDVAQHLHSSLHHGISNPMVVYVDDEEENIFIFKRKYGKIFRLQTFTDPLLALDFILKTPEVALVLTDEVMPGMNGNELCDRVRDERPVIKFILITGNPGSDENLIHRTLRLGRFHEFMNKPLDFEKKGEEYREMIQSVLEGRT